MTDRRGIALCLASSAGFGAMAIFAKEAYDGGATVATLLTVRFVLAAVVLWVLVLRRPQRPVRLLAGPGLALGVLYAIEAGAFFLALERIDAALAELLLYGYPALVVVGAALGGRDALTRSRAVALALATLGVALVLAAGDIGTLDGLGVAMALTSAVLYAGYVLASDRVVAKADPLVLTAQVVLGAALVVSTYGLARGQVDLGAMDAKGWTATLCIALLSTVVPILAFLDGMKRVGPATATIVSCVEPVFTVVLAMAVLGERLAPAQLGGGLLVLVALVLLARAGGTAAATLGGDVAPVAPDRPAPARDLVESAA